MFWFNLIAAPLLVMLFVANAYQLGRRDELAGTLQCHEQLKHVLAGWEHTTGVLEETTALLRESSK